MFTSPNEEISNKNLTHGWHNTHATLCPQLSNYKLTHGIIRKVIKPKYALLWPI
jgi:hypothetical protein